MLSNPDEFRFFLPSVGGEDTADAMSHDGVMTEKEYGRYCDNVANTGEWGGEPEVSVATLGGNKRNQQCRLWYPPCFDGYTIADMPDPSSLANLQYPDPRHTTRTTHGRVPRWRQ